MKLAEACFPASCFVLRTPLLPFEEVLRWSRGACAPEVVGGAGDLETALEQDREAFRAHLALLLARPDVREALFLASPELAARLPVWEEAPRSKQGRRIEVGLVRYFLRLASRPTPFGLFAGCSAGRLGEATHLALAGGESYRRHSRLDMDYLFALCEHLVRLPQVRPHLLFFPTSSLYFLAGRLRYAETHLREHDRTSRLVAVESFPLLARTLDRAGGGARLSDLATALIADDPDGEITLEEAEDFVEELAASQLLVPELSPLVTGGEALADLARRLRDLPLDPEIVATLETAQETLAELDSRGLGASPETYRSLSLSLGPLGVPVELSRLIQVDLYKPAPELTLGPDVIAELLTAVEVLHAQARPLRDDPLRAFARNFEARYGEAREVPLVEALDEEMGIGFERSASAAAEGSPLLAELGLAPREEVPTVPWAERESFLLRRLNEALEAGVWEIDVGADELRSLGSAILPPLPIAFHAMATLVAASSRAVEAGDFTLLFHGASGPSGARLLGRFCHGDPEIHRCVAEHLAAEEALNPQALFAEIVHLPAGRVGNVLARPLLRSYEIPFLGRSGASPEHQIAVTDLTVTVLGGQIFLRSRSLDRPVLPRLTTAHNAAGKNLGLYRFLAALQNQGQAAGLAWSWGALEASPFLPRVRCGRLVLSRARLRLGRDEIAHFSEVRGAERFRRIWRWREEARLPRFLALADGDNELLIDLDNTLSIDAWLGLVKNRTSCGLVEFYPGPEELCAEGPEGRFVHQIIVPFTRERRRPAGPPSRTPPSPARITTFSPAPERIFLPGSRWLYLKLYTGTSTADRLLREVLGPVVRTAIAEGVARRWFFLRYADPHWHLRLRLEGEPEALSRSVLPALHERLNHSFRGGEAWKLQIDTYEREVERYGGPEGIELAEELFFRDSESVLAILETLDGDAGADNRWRLTLAGMDRLLVDFGQDLAERRDLALRMRDTYAGRYRVGELQRHLAARLRQERGHLEQLLETHSEVAPAPLTDLGAGLAALSRRGRALAPIVTELRRRDGEGRLAPPFAQIIPSFIHMFVNRLTRSAGPEHEYILYDFLAQLYASRLARQRGGRKREEAPPEDLG